MIKMLLKEIVERLGTGLGTALSAYGVGHDDITILVAAIPVLLGLLVDILTKSYLKRK